MRSEKIVKVAAYFRVSTKGQGESDRLGLPAQRAAVAKFCNSSGYQIVADFEDRGYSGATADRPALADLLSRAHDSGFQAVIVAKWDRLARDTMLDGFLRYSLSAAGIPVYSATEDNGVDPMAALTQTILAAVAQFERHLIRQRLMSARRLKRERGGYAEGRPRFGTRASNGALSANPDELVVISTAKRLRRSKKTFREIARALDMAGFKPRSGGKWSASTIHGILKRRNGSKSNCKIK
jgi:DNA invertase Pin-like site-specific DNA recombinase